MNRAASHVRSRPEPLAQVELLVLFHPMLQNGCGHRAPDGIAAKATQGWLTVDVFGVPGKSDITGRAVLEDMRVEVGGEDIEHLLPDNVVHAIADYVLDN